jgi:hypothetical protein
MTNIDTATATAFMAANKGNDIMVKLAGMPLPVRGVAISVNSKGVNIKDIDGRVRSFSLTRVVGLDTPAADVTDGLTTADVAALVGTTPKALRVITRSLGLGVGRGRRYTFDTADVTAIRAAMTDAN